MARYDVYGVGNALVDQEFEVEDSFFAENNIEKGLMTLVEFDQQEALLAALRNRYGLKKQAGGGSAGNTLYALSQFGGEAYFACKIASDDTGDFYLNELGHHNIDTNIGYREDGTSGRCVVMISPDAERTMHTYLGVSVNFSLEELDFDAAARSEYIYIEGYMVTSPPAKAAIMKLKSFAEENQVKTAMTFSDPAMLEYFKDHINDALGAGVDMLFCNLQEAQLWSGKESIDEVCEALKTKARRFALTLGPDGALLFDGAKFIEIAGNEVEAVDTNGAGDMFAGAFMYAITQGMDFTTAGKLASLAASKVVSKFGPRLKSSEHADILVEAGLLNSN
jgi:fructokinase